MLPLDDQPRLSRLRRLVEGTPLDILVKWAVVVLVALEGLRFVMSQLSDLWRLIAPWVS